MESFCTSHWFRGTQGHQDGAGWRSPEPRGREVSDVSVVFHLEAFVDFRPHLVLGWRCCLRAKSFTSSPTLCDPVDCTPPDSSVHGILQARVLEWGAMPSSGGSSRPRDRIHISYVSCAGRQALYH